MMITGASQAGCTTPGSLSLSAVSREYVPSRGVERAGGLDDASRNLGRGSKGNRCFFGGRALGGLGWGCRDNSCVKDVVEAVRGARVKLLYAVAIRCQERAMSRTSRSPGSGRVK